MAFENRRRPTLAQDRDRYVREDGVYGGSSADCDSLATGVEDLEACWLRMNQDPYVMNLRPSRWACIREKAFEIKPAGHPTPEMTCAAHLRACLRPARRVAGHRPVTARIVGELASGLCVREVT